MDGRPPGTAMCASSSTALLSYGLRVPTPYSPFSPGMGSLSSLDFQRSALCDYGVRLQYGVRGLGLPAYPLPLHDPYASYLHRQDLRARYLAEEPKPSHSYIGLIAMAILSSKDKKLVLSDIYQWILDNYPYFRSRGPGWRNSIRHNLSLNDCFVKAGRSANGKGHYWGIHPANIEDFKRGDFRRRRAQRKVRKHMGLAVPDDEDSPSPSPTPTPLPPPGLEPGAEGRDPGEHGDGRPGEGPGEVGVARNGLGLAPPLGELPLVPQKPARKRLFDMESLLAPEPPLPPSLPTPRRSPPPSPAPRGEESDAEVDIVSEGDGAPVLERPELGEAEAPRPDPPSLGTPSPCPSPLSPASDDAGQESGASRPPQWSLSTPGLHPTPTRPSAFQATRSAPWDTYPTYIYPLLGSSYPMVMPNSARWRQALYGSLEPARPQGEAADST